MSQVAGVELAVPVVSGTAFIPDDAGELLTVHGVDIMSDAAVRVYDPRDKAGLPVDDLISVSQLGSVVLTREFATRRKVQIDDSIELETPAGRHRFTVRGLLEPQGVARVHGGNLVVMDLHTAQATFTRPGLVNRVDVVVARDRSVSSVQDAIAAILPAGLWVQPPEQRKVDLHSVMRSLQTALQAGGMLGLVAAFFIAFNRLATVFEARAWQLGVMRAVGARESTVWWQLVVESLLLGFAGVGIGIPLGIGVGRAVLPLIAVTTALSSKLVAPDADLAIHPWSVALAASLGIGTAFISALLPAWRASRVPVAETLRSSGTEQRGASEAAKWSVRGVSVLGTTGAVSMALTGSAAWGIVASALLVLTAALLARPLLDFVVAPLLPVASRFTGWIGRFALATLIASPRRAALTIATLGVGFGTVLWLTMLANSFEQSVVQAMPGVLRGDLAVSSTHIGAGFVEAPIDDGLVAELGQIEGVSAVAGEDGVDWRYGGGPIAINAFDSRYFTDPAFGEWPLIGRRLPDAWDQVARGEAAVISTNFAQHLRVGVGDSITLETPNGPLSLRIAGVTTDFLSPRGTLEISRELFKRYWNDNRIIRCLVRLAPGAGVDGVRAEIEHRLGRRYSLKVLSLGELIQWFVTQVRRAFGGIYVLAGIVLLVVLVGVADTLAAAVFERTRDLGVLRATGVQRTSIGRMVLMEGLFLGTLGLVLAGATGISLGALWVEATFPSLLGWTLEFHIPYGPGALIGALSLIVCAVAAMIPGWRAARLEPAVALQYE